MCLTKEQCYYIKGLSILLIMIHNFEDWLFGIVCNEMSYVQSRTDVFLAGVFTKYSIWYVFAFAGWVGVALFFFLSGYGLSKKYEEKRINKLDYMKIHFIKLWKLLIPIYILYILVASCFFGESFSFINVIAQLTLTINLFQSGSINPGVYWFFGAIIQFYFLFLCIRKMNTKWLIAFMLLFLFFNYIILYFTNENTMEWTRHNFVGWAVPFLLGMIFARKKICFSKYNSRILCSISFLFLSLCLTVKALIPLTEIVAIVFILSFCDCFRIKVFFNIGVISASVFVIHPFVRLIILNTYCSSNYPLIMTTIYVSLVLSISWLHYRLLNYGKAHKVN